MIRSYLPSGRRVISSVLARFQRQSSSGLIWLVSGRWRICPAMAFSGCRCVQCRPTHELGGAGQSVPHLRHMQLVQHQQGVGFLIGLPTVHLTGSCLPDLVVCADNTVLAKLHCIDFLVAINSLGTGGLGPPRALVGTGVEQCKRRRQQVHHPCRLLGA